MSVRYWRLLLGPSHQSSILGGSIIQAMQDFHGVDSWHNNKSNKNINYIAVVVVVSDYIFVLFAFSISYQVSTETARLFCVMILLLMRFNLLQLLLLMLLLQKPRRLNARRPSAPGIGIAGAPVEFHPWFLRFPSWA